jgi:hypothetical protein
VPVIKGMNQKLYFFPDKVLVEGSGIFGAVSYDNLGIDSTKTRFIENGNVPPDARVVDTTWKYVNKKGGPDKRYRDNRQLPIIECGELCISAQNGLKVVLQLSNLEICNVFQQSLLYFIKAGNWASHNPKQPIEV